jgi:hypothetical protein
MSRAAAKIPATRPAVSLKVPALNDTTVRLHHLLNGAAQMFPDGHTRIEGLKRNGLPYIGEGQLLRVDARFCTVPGSVDTKIVARHIVPAGPIIAPSTAEDPRRRLARRPDIVSKATGGLAGQWPS